MKVVILAGGRGTRLSEETAMRPKPMVEIGGHPILWHIMMIYSSYGFNDFLVCLGYKGYMIKEYFYNYFLHGSDVTIDLSKNRIEYHQTRSQPWRVTLADTGPDTMTGGRLARVAPYLKNEETFLMTYGDGVSDVNIPKLIEHHKNHSVDATMTVVRPPARFGTVKMDNGIITEFIEKPHATSGFINGGFFVVNRNVLDLIEGDDTVWETGPIDRLTAERRVAAHCHTGFWQPMDTLRDKEYLESLWLAGEAPWKIW